MGATLSQPYIPMPPRSIKSKSKKRPRYLFRLRIRWKKKRTLPEIHAPYPSPGHDHQESRESKLYDGSSAEGEEKSPVSDSHTITSTTPTRPAPTSPLAETAPGVLDLHSLPKLSSASVPSPSRPDRKLHYSLPVSFTTEKPLPKLPRVITSADQFPAQQAQLNSFNELPATEAIQVINPPIDSTVQEDENEIKYDTPDSNYDADSNFPPEIERPHTPPPWDTSLSGYGSVLEVSRPFRARRVFEHPLVEGHFLGNMGDTFFMSGGPIAAEKRRRVWRVWESTKGKKKGKGKGKGKEKETEKGKEKERGEYKNGGVNGHEWKKKKKKMTTKVGLRSGRQKAIEGRERERERGKKRTKTKRMSEWRKWKPLPRYPACTGVAQRATSSTWAAAAAATATDDSDSAWREVVEQAEDQEYQGGDETTEEAEEDEDLEEAIKKFLEIKIPVDLSSLRRLRTSFAGTGEHTTTMDSGTRESAGGKVGNENIEKAREGEQGQLSPVESLMFTDTDIEGFEFLFEEEDEGGGTWDSEPAAGVKSGRVEGKGEACGTDGPIGGFAGGDASRQEVSEDAEQKLTVRTAFSATQRLSRWKERE